MKSKVILKVFLLPSLLAALATISMPEKAMAQLPSNEDQYRVAQMDPDEAYDPFTDYSEFDEESDEEADINFFRNGRFLTAGVGGGIRGFTGNFADTYESGPDFGIFLTYFFDLRLAMSLSFQTGDHGVRFQTESGGIVKDTFTGNVSITSINVDLKYYMNTQNVTRGLADLNPYILGGFGNFYRTYTLTSTAGAVDGYARDSTMGFDLGAGLEIPLMRKKAFLGVQAVYHYVEFRDESKLHVDGGDKLVKPISGDFYSLHAIIGLNF